MRNVSLYHSNHQLQSNNTDIPSKPSAAPEKLLEHQPSIEKLRYLTDWDSSTTALFKMISAELYADDATALFYVANYDWSRGLRQDAPEILRKMARTIADKLEHHPADYQHIVSSVAGTAKKVVVVDSSASGRMLTDIGNNIIKRVFTELLIDAIPIPGLRPVKDLIADLRSIYDGNYTTQGRLRETGEALANFERKLNNNSLPLSPENNKQLKGYLATVTPWLRDVSNTWESIELDIAILEDTPSLLAKTQQVMALTERLLATPQLRSVSDDATLATFRQGLSAIRITLGQVQLYQALPGTTGVADYLGILADNPLITKIINEQTLRLGQIVAQIHTDEPYPANEGFDNQLDWLVTTLADPAPRQQMQPHLEMLLGSQSRADQLFALCQFADQLRHCPQDGSLSEQGLWLLEMLGTQKAAIPLLAGAQKFQAVLGGDGKSLALLEGMLSSKPGAWGSMISEFGKVAAPDVGRRVLQQAAARLLPPFVAQELESFARQCSWNESVSSLLQRSATSAWNIGKPYLVGQMVADPLAATTVQYAETLQNRTDFGAILEWFVAHDRSRDKALQSVYGQYLNALLVWQVYQAVNNKNIDEAESKLRELAAHLKDYQVVRNYPQLEKFIDIIPLFPALKEAQQLLGSLPSTDSWLSWGKQSLNALAGSENPRLQNLREQLSRRVETWTADAVMSLCHTLVEQPLGLLPGAAAAPSLSLEPTESSATVETGQSGVGVNSKLAAGISLEVLGIAAIAYGLWKMRHPQEAPAPEPNATKMELLGASKHLPDDRDNVPASEQSTMLPANKAAKAASPTDKTSRQAGQIPLVLGIASAVTGLACLASWYRGNGAGGDSANVKLLTLLKNNQHSVEFGATGTLQVTSTEQAIRQAMAKYPGDLHNPALLSEVTAILKSDSVFLESAVQIRGSSYIPLPGDAASAVKREAVLESSPLVAITQRKRRSPEPNAGSSLKGRISSDGNAEGLPKPAALQSTTGNTDAGRLTNADRQIAQSVIDELSKSPQDDSRDKSLFDSGLVKALEQQGDFDIPADKELAWLELYKEYQAILEQLLQHPNENAVDLARTAELHSRFIRAHFELARLESVINNKISEKDAYVTGARIIQEAKNNSPSVNMSTLKFTASGTTIGDPNWRLEIDIPNILVITESRDQNNMMRGGVVLYDSNGIWSYLPNKATLEQYISLHNLTKGGAMTPNSNGQAYSLMPSIISATPAKDRVNLQRYLTNASTSPVPVVTDGIKTVDIKGANFEEKFNTFAANAFPKQAVVAPPTQLARQAEQAGKTLANIFTKDDIAYDRFLNKSVTNGLKEILTRQGIDVYEVDLKIEDFEIEINGVRGTPVEWVHNQYRTREQKQSKPLSSDNPFVSQNHLPGRVIHMIGNTAKSFWDTFTTENNDNPTAGGVRFTRVPEGLIFGETSSKTIDRLNRNMRVLNGTIEYFRQTYTGDMYADYLQDLHMPAASEFNRSWVESTRLNMKYAAQQVKDSRYITPAEEQRINSTIERAAGRSGDPYFPLDSLGTFELTSGSGQPTYIPGLITINLSGSTEKFIYIPDAPYGQSLYKESHFLSMLKSDFSLRNIVEERTRITDKTRTDQLFRSNSATLRITSTHLKNLPAQGTSDLSKMAGTQLDDLIKDVRQLTTSRDEVIKGIIGKMVKYFAAAACMGTSGVFVAACGVATVGLIGDSIKDVIKDMQNGDADSALLKAWLLPLEASDALPALGLLIKGIGHSAKALSLAVGKPISTISEATDAIQNVISWNKCILPDGGLNPAMAVKNLDFGNATRITPMRGFVGEFFEMEKKKWIKDGANCYEVYISPDWGSVRLNDKYGPLISFRNGKWQLDRAVLSGAGKDPKRLDLPKPTAIEWPADTQDVMTSTFWNNRLGKDYAKFATMKDFWSKYYPKNMTHIKERELTDVVKQSGEILKKIESAGMGLDPTYRQLVIYRGTKRSEADSVARWNTMRTESENFIRNWKPNPASPDTEAAQFKASVAQQVAGRAHNEPVIMPIKKHLGDLAQAQNYARGPDEALLKITLKPGAERVMFDPDYMAVSGTGKGERGIALSQGGERYFPKGSDNEGALGGYIGVKPETHGPFSLSLGGDNKTGLPKDPTSTLFQLFVDTVEIV